MSKQRNLQCTSFKLVMKSSEWQFWIKCIFLSFLFQLPEEVSQWSINRILYVCLYHTTSIPAYVYVAFSSTRGKDKCTWRKISSKETLLLHAHQPSSICGRCPPASASRQENISLCPRLLSPTRMATSTCGSFRRNRLTSSMPLTQTSTNFEKKNLKKKQCLTIFFCASFSEIDDPVDCHVEEVNCGLSKYTN